MQDALKKGVRHTRVPQSLQEFDLSVRTSDAEAQIAVLQRCQATKGLSPQNYLTMAALCRQSGGGVASQQACLKAALRHLSQQMPVTEFELIAQVWTGWSGFWQIERVLSLLEE